MPPAEQVIQNLRRCLTRYDGRLPADAEAAATAYVASVDEVNARLASCVRLLREGLRSEALHLAEQSPPVAEEAAALDFPQREQWLALCREHDLPAPPAVDAEAVAELNEAYAQEESIEPLLRAHRRLALGRAALTDRIRILNNLARADPLNPAWRDDLATFERARHQQIEQAAQQAFAAGDLNTLEQLHAECARDTWLAPPPPPLKRQVERLCVSLRHRVAQHELVELEHQIAEAHANADIDRTTGLLRAWRDAAARSSVGTPSLPASTSAAEQWVRGQREATEQQAEFDQACAALETALTGDADAQTLRRRWKALKAFGGDVPESLERRYQARLARHRQASQRRWRAAVAGGVAAIVLLTAVAGYGVYLAVQSREAGAWERQLTDLVDEGEWYEARDLLDDLREQRPRLWGRADIQAMARDVDRGVQEDAVRREQFLAAVARVEQSPPHAPDREALSEARQLIATDQEQLQVERLTREIEQAEAEARQERDAAHAETLDDLRRRFVSARGEGERQQVSELVALHDDADALLDAELSESMQASVESLIDSIRREIDRHDQRLVEDRRRRARLAEIRRHHTDPDRLAAALSSFADAFPEDDRSGSFRDAAAIAEEAARIEGVRNEVARLPPLRVGDFEVAKEQQDRVERLLDASAASPYHDALQRYLDYLRQAVAALDPAQATHRRDGPLDRLLSHPLVADLQMLRTGDGDRYYFPADAAPDLAASDANPLQLDYAARPEQLFQGERLARALLPRQELRDDEPVPAPQSLFANRVREMLADDPPPWEHRHLGLAAAAIEVEGLDPLMKLMLVSELVDLAVRHDWPTPSEAASWRERAEPLLARNVNWLDPENRDEADAARSEARQLLSALPDLAAHADAADAELAAIQHQLGPREPVGILWKDDIDQSLGTGDRIITGTAAQRHRGPLERLVVDGGEARFEAIAEAGPDGIEWHASPSDLPLGLVIYRRQ